MKENYLIFYDEKELADCTIHKYCNNVRYLGLQSKINGTYLSICLFVKSWCMVELYDFLRNNIGIFFFFMRLISYRI